MKNGLVVMVVDGGGRGSALVDKYSQSKKVKKILAVPGNDLMGINTKKPVKTYPDLKTTSVSEILELCKKEKVDLVDVAQDNGVEAGLTNVLVSNGIKAIGPTREAGQIEWDKGWAREFMKKYNLPIPEFRVFSSIDEGIRFLKNSKERAWFVKASGLAEGKGALPAQNNKEAMQRIKELQKFGKASEIYLLEEWLLGEEFSAFAISDGESFKVVGFAQDYKRVNNFDDGENTGGMGCSSPPLVLSKSKIKDQISKIFNNTFEGLRKEGRLYQGILYMGGILVNEQIKIIEFNARWGDPEAEVLIPGIKNDFVSVAEAIIFKKLKRLKIELDNKSRIAVAGCSKGYPADYSEVKGKRIFGLNKIPKDLKLYSAGIKKDGKNYLAAGGRLFYVVAEGKDVIEAREKAYGAMSQIFIEGNNLHYRTDIGYRDVERLNVKS